MTAVDHEHAARLVTHLSQQRSSGKYCDVCVCVGEQRFLAHKCVLSANSDKLDALILDATGEDNTSHDIEIEIHGVSSVGFEIVLENFYTGVLKLEPSTVTHTWMTAAYLGLPDVVNRCNTYCQQSVCVTAHPGITSSLTSFSPSPLITQQAQTTISTVNVDANNNDSVISIQSSDSNVQDAVPTQIPPPLPSTEENKITNEQNVEEPENIKSNQTKDGGKNQPYEIRENQEVTEENGEEAGESASKKSKYLTMDESAIAWSPYTAHANTTGQAASITNAAVPMTLPVSSMPQVVVNLVQGYGAYQPVDLNWSGTPQQWAHVQVGKGQFLTTGVIPLASQVKHEPVPTPATAVQLVGETANGNNLTEGTSAGESSPISYTTLSLVSQDPPQQNETRTEIESANSDRQNTPQAGAQSTNASVNEGLTNAIAVPIVTPRSHSVMPTQELNLDNIHFTQLPPDDQQQRLTSTPAHFSSPATTSASYIQPLMNNLAVSNSSSDDAHCDTMMLQVEQLRIQHQQLQRLQQESENPESTNDVKSVLATSKRKRKAPTKLSKSEDSSNAETHELHAHSNIRKSRSLVDSVPVAITPEHMEFLYQKYPEIKKEPPITGGSDVVQLLQHGKARQRKSSEQNALNNTIRTILDTTGIVESGDARVQDAVCLIMDRFAVLQEHMNDAYVRKQLTIKVKHSIHCKKWRLKRHKMKQLEMSSSSSPDSQVTTWLADPNNSNITIGNNSLLKEESLHS